MQRKFIYIGAAFFLAIMAMYLINIYLKEEAKGARDRAKRDVMKMQEMQATVVVAKNDIPKGTTLNQDMLETKTILKDYLQPKAVLAPERVLGMVTVVPIYQGEQITFNKLLVSKESITSTSLAMVTPIGKRAISIPADNISSLMGMIKPGDYVDVIATIPVPVQTPDGKQTIQAAVVPLFQNILVLAIDQQLSAVESETKPRYATQQPAPAPTQPGAPSTFITLALTPQEANLMSFVQEQGKIRLSLRSPADSRIEPVQVANWENLLSFLVPQATKDKMEKEKNKEGQLQEQVKPKPREIEIYRGLKKDLIAVSGEK